MEGHCAFVECTLGGLMRWPVSAAIRRAYKSFAPDILLVSLPRLGLLWSLDATYEYVKARLLHEVAANGPFEAIFGWSQGAYMIHRFAMEYPDFVKTVFEMAPPHQGSWRAVNFRHLQAVSDMRPGSQPLLEAQAVVPPDDIPDIHVLIAGRDLLIRPEAHKAPGVAKYVCFGTKLPDGVPLGTILVETSRQPDHFGLPFLKEVCEYMANCLGNQPNPAATRTVGIAA